MSGVVIDASVALKWLFDDEDGVVQALALRDRYLSDPVSFPLLAPSLWRYEVINGLWVATCRGRLSEDEAQEALADLLEIGVELIEPEGTRMLQLAKEYGIAVYDAAYLAVAEMTGCLLWTSDRPFFEAVRKRRDDVDWIGEYTAS